MKVVIKDFQIIKSAALDFEPGLTAILGESNNGKSAIFRAIMSAIYNEPGTTNIRFGANAYMVGIEHNNHKVILQKGANSLYLVDGEKYTKIGKTQLDEVANALNIRSLSINGSTEKINFWNQMEKPFLLDRNASDLFRFIVDSGEDDNLNVTLRTMVTDKNKFNTELSLKEGAINNTDERIKSLKSTLAGSKEVITLCESIIAYGPKISRTVSINNIINNITSNNISIEEEKERVREYKSRAEERQNNLNTLSYKISKKQQLSEKISKIESNTRNIQMLQSALSVSKRYTEDAKALQSTIDKKTALQAILVKIADNTKQINSIVIHKITLPFDEKKVVKSTTLKMLLQQINNTTNAIADATRSKEALVSIKNDLEKQLSEFKICPLCGKPIDSVEMHKEVEVDSTKDINVENGLQTVNAVLGGLV